jgi:hypothetical protein
MALFVSWRPCQFVGIFCVVLLLCSRLYSEYLARHLRIIRPDTEIRGFRHEWIDVELSMENNGLLPAFMVILQDSPGMLGVFRVNKTIANLPGRYAARRRCILIWQGFGSERGLYELGPAQVSGSDPLGIFPFVLVSSETCRLFVYPAPGFIALKPPGGIPLGSLLSNNPFNEDLTRRKTLREYTGGDELRRITHPVMDLTAVASAAEVFALQEAVAQIHVDTQVRNYLLALVAATRQNPALRAGISPRGSLALYRASQAMAALKGRDFVSPVDIKEMAAPVFRQRLLLSSDSLVRGIQPDRIIESFLDSVSMPEYRNAS